MRRSLMCGVLVACGFMGRPLAAQSATEPTLDFEFFRTRVQPILLAKRPGHSRCVKCHGDEPRNPRLVPLKPNRFMWDEAESRKNFEEFSKVVVPGSIKSRLLVHPLAQAAGGDFDHGGGKHFKSQDHPEWQTLKAWVMGSKAPAPGPGNKVRLVQTNFAGDNIHIIDPATNKVVAEIPGIELVHGVAAAPDGSRLYVSNEAESSLDVIDARVLLLFARIPLSGRPNNVGISRDGRKVYVSIVSAPGAVDVIDTTSLQKVKTIPTEMGIHNTYVTPDGRFAIAGSIRGNAAKIIDTQTDEIVRTITMDQGVRPMAFLTNPDGSTKWLFIQLTTLNGFAVVDFETGKELRRIEHPALPAGRTKIPAAGEISHGMAVTPDGKTLVVNSRVDSALYSYSLPDLKLAGTANLTAIGAGWVSIVPDGTRAYVANTVTNDVSVVDIQSMKEIARIPVGEGPRRNIVAMLP